MNPLDSTQRTKLLREVAGGERKMDSDVLARIALDEINELNKALENYNAKPLPTFVKKGSQVIE